MPQKGLKNCNAKGGFWVEPGHPVKGALVLNSFGACFWRVGAEVIALGTSPVPRLHLFDPFAVMDPFRCRWIAVGIGGKILLVGIDSEVLEAILWKFAPMHPCSSSSRSR